MKNLTLIIDKLDSFFIGRKTCFSEFDQAGHYRFKNLLVYLSLVTLVDRRNPRYLAIPISSLLIGFSP